MTAKTLRQIPPAAPEHRQPGRAVCAGPAGVDLVHFVSEQDHVLRNDCDAVLSARGADIIIEQF